MRQERVQAARVPRVVLCLTAVVIAVAGTRALATTDGRPDQLPAFLVPLELTTAVDLPSAARASLIDEADAIWRRAGVRLQWRTFTGPLAPQDSALRVLVMMRAGSVTNGPESAWPVAELVPDQAGDALAIASIHGARRVLEAAGYLGEGAALQEFRLGVILGRAVAHEIGHYLLCTGGHARYGLMRTGVDARDFADLRNGAFYLDKEALRWVRQSLHPRPVAAARVAGFTY